VILGKLASKEGGGAMPQRQNSVSRRSCPGFLWIIWVIARTTRRWICCYLWGGPKGINWFRKLARNNYDLGAMLAGEIQNDIQEVIVRSTHLDAEMIRQTLIENIVIDIQRSQPILTRE
jgi:hypothetical protein